MKRRHHNNKGTRQIQRGKTTDDVERMAKRLLKKNKNQLTNSYR